MINYTQRVTEPSAFVTKGRQRIKQYGNTVYLNNRDEFEIELFNPTTSKILAEIYVNGKSIGSSRGIVLRPGERVFLERFLNDSQKFLFETYEVNGADSDVQRAIAENGNVEVRFFTEQSNNFLYGYGSGGTVTINTPWPTWTYYTSSGSNLENAKSGDLGFGDIGNTTFTSSVNYSAPAAGPMDLKREFMSIETGRVEKGSHSNQSFDYDYTAFNSWWSWKSEWKILPLSQKPYESEDIKVFCTKCGTRRKKSSHNFCPKCGTKY